MVQKIDIFVKLVENYFFQCYIDAIEHSTNFKRTEKRSLCNMEKEEERHTRSNDYGYFDNKIIRQPFAIHSGTRRIWSASGIHRTLRKRLCSH